MCTRLCTRGGTLTRNKKSCQTQLCLYHWSVAFVQNIFFKLGLNPKHKDIHFLLNNRHMVSLQLRQQSRINSLLQLHLLKLWPPFMAKKSQNTVFEIVFQHTFSAVPCYGDDFCLSPFTITPLSSNFQGYKYRPL